MRLLKLFRCTEKVSLLYLNFLLFTTEHCIHLYNMHTICFTNFYKLLTENLNKRDSLFIIYYNQGSGDLMRLKS